MERMLINAAIMLLPLFFSLAVLHYLSFKQRNYLNPLSKSIRRPAGTQLARQLGGEQLSIGFSLAFVFCGFFFIPFNSFQSTTSETIIFAVTGVLFAIGGLCDLARRFKRIQVLRLGYECELAVGQELDQLMLKGFRVFHDIPAEGFNIDHLVVSPAGVFVVETKGRSKRKSSRKNPKTEFKVVYKNGVLKFPGWQEVLPIKQAQSQAKWVRNWLTKATGFEVLSLPVIVLPGWYVQQASKPDIPVLALGFVERFFTKFNPGTRPLSEQKIQQISYQVEQRVRDLAPGEIVRPL
ncbi:nuclease-related domain-containing protein [Porticoccus sp. GXU_MW_L64]